MIVLFALSVLLLVFVALTLALQWAERRFPTFSRWLDEHVGVEQPWGKF